jgi:hypothetical protein
MTTTSPVILIPMAGASSRFAAEAARVPAYSQPKFRLPLWGGTVFDCAIAGFQEHFDDAQFVCVVRDRAAFDFAFGHARHAGVRNLQLITEQSPTSFWQTVHVGLSRARGIAERPLVVSPVDTFRLNFQRMQGVGHYTEFAPRNLNAKYTAGISAPNSAEMSKALKNTAALPFLRHTGVYNFTNSTVLGDVLDEMAKDRPAFIARSSLASLSRHIGFSIDMAEGLAIQSAFARRAQPLRARLISAHDVVFCGVPAEYEALVSKPRPAAIELR